MRFCILYSKDNTLKNGTAVPDIYSAIDIDRYVVLFDKVFNISSEKPIVRIRKSLRLRNNIEFRGPLATDIITNLPFAVYRIYNASTRACEWHILGYRREVYIDI